MTDYEILGRYTAAREAFDRALLRRKKAIIDLKLHADRLLNASMSQGYALSFDFEDAERLLAEAKEADTEARLAVADANSVAAQAGKPLLVWR